MYTLKNTNTTLDDEQIRQVIRDNQHLVEKKEESKFFEPKKEETYHYLESYKITFSERESIEPLESMQIIRGVYRTSEEAELADQKRLALVRMWKYADENMYFRPDWGDSDEIKHYVYYQHESEKFSITFNQCHQYEFTLPYFKSEADCEKFLKDNESDLLIMLK